MAYIRMGRPAARVRGTNFVPGGFGREGAQRFSLSARPLMLSPLSQLSSPNAGSERGTLAPAPSDAGASSEAA